MDWLLLTAVSVIFRAIYGVMTKVFSNQINVSVYTQSTILPLAAAAIAVVLSPLLGGLQLNLSGVSLAALILVMVGQGLGNIAYFASIKNLTNGTAQIAFSSILVFNTLLSLIFLNLHLSPLNVFGIFLLMLAVLTVVTGKVDLHRKGVALMVLSAFLFSIFQLASAEVSQQVSAATYLITAYSGAALVVFILKAKVVVRDLSKAAKRSALGLPLLTALPSVGYYLFAYYAYRSAPQPAKVAILLTAQVVLAVLLSYYFLKEKTHLLRKILAAVLVVIAAALIKN